MNPPKALLAIARSVLILQACGDGGATETKPVVAKFEAPKEGFEHCPFRVTNLSENADSFTWDLGQGQASVEKEPLLNLAQAGEHSIKLTAENSSSTADFIAQILIRQDTTYIQPETNTSLETSGTDIVSLNDGSSVGLIQVGLDAAPYRLVKRSSTGEFIAGLILSQSIHYRRLLYLGESAVGEKDLLMFKDAKYVLLSSSLSSATLTEVEIRHETTPLYPTDAVVQDGVLVMAGYNGEQRYLQRIRLVDGEELSYEEWGGSGVTLRVLLAVDAKGIYVIDRFEPVAGGHRFKASILDLEGRFVRDIGGIDLPRDASIHSMAVFNGIIYMSYGKVYRFEDSGLVSTFATNSDAPTLLVSASGDLVTVGTRQGGIAGTGDRLFLVFGRYDSQGNLLAQGDTPAKYQQALNFRAIRATESRDCGILVSAEHATPDSVYDHHSVFLKFSANGKI